MPYRCNTSSITLSLEIGQWRYYTGTRQKVNLFWWKLTNRSISTKKGSKKCRFLKHKYKMPTQIIHYILHITDLHNFTISSEHGTLYGNAGT